MTKRQQQERAYLSDLLALIHRDGGHYEERVGTARAFHSARKKLTRIYLVACFQRDSRCLLRKLGH